MIGIGFNGAETNCGIAHILGILLMNSYKIQICSEARSPLNIKDNINLLVYKNETSY